MIITRYCARSRNTYGEASVVTTGEAPEHSSKQFACERGLLLQEVWQSSPRAVTTGFVPGATGFVLKAPGAHLSPDGTSSVQHLWLAQIEQQLTPELAAELFKARSSPPRAVASLSCLTVCLWHGLRTRVCFVVCETDAPRPCTVGRPVVRKKTKTI